MFEVQDYDYDAEALLKACEKSVVKYNGVLSGMGFVNGIDEIAVQVPNRLSLLNLAQSIVGMDGVVISNSASDHVNTEPLRTCYRVDYLFATGLALTRPNEFRIEIMSKKQGFSPLHDAMSADLDNGEGAPWLVHASFKLQNEDDYGSALHRLKQNSYECAQRCTSSYGRFSYWKPLDMDPKEHLNSFLWLKPRVNLRDAR